MNLKCFNETTFNLTIYDGYPMHRIILSFALILSAFAASASNMLIHPQTLNDKLINLEQLSSSIKIVDLRSKEDYLEGHIPHAIHLPISQFHRKKSDIEGFIQTPRRFKSALEAAGITNSDHLIIYSDWSFLDSARFYWALDFYGHSTKQILDGGYQGWINSGLQISTKPTSITKTSQYIVQVQPEKMATKFQTLMASKSPEYVIIDARPKAHYLAEKSLTPVKGRIPNAINIPWHSLLTNREASDEYGRIQKTVSFYNTERLEDTLSDIPKDKKIILYCNGGAESSILYLGLKQLGVQAAVYDGSWFEWSLDNKLPVELKP